jgi:DNA-binding CsgD family transcriptional regulator
MSGAGADGKYLDENEGSIAWKHGMSVAEIALVCGCSENSVRVTLDRALKKLRRNNERLAEYL